MTKPERQSSASPEAAQSASEQARTLRWFCGVPVFANPLILLDLLSASALLWFGTVLAMAAAQRIFGGALHGEHLRAASIFASYLAAALACLFAGVSVIFYRQGYAVLYRFEKAGLFSETMRISGPSGGSLLNRLPFAVRGDLNPARSVTKEIEWEDVLEVKPLAELRVLLLKGKWSTLMRVYCPDEKIFKEAFNFAREQVSFYGKK